MNLIYVSFFVLIPLSLFSVVVKKSFLLPILLALESCLLMLLVVKFLISFFIVSSFMNGGFSLYMIALAAIEASMGLSLLTLISRGFLSCSMKYLSLLKK